METTLKNAFERASRLSPQKQKTLAEEIIFELENENAWDNEKRELPDEILKLAVEAKEGLKKGNLESLDPDKL
ncbi:MAG: hypothetical protein J0M18_08935 [Ignavibacteria bacterium]|jgi:hypothetical protein|nr:hypothetical protein [Ignavibacteria bacterium]